MRRADDVSPARQRRSVRSRGPYGAFFLLFLFLSYVLCFWNEKEFSLRPTHYSRPLLIRGRLRGRNIVIRRTVGRVHLGR